MDEDNIPLTEESSIFKYFSTGLKNFFKSLANTSRGIVSYRKMKSFYYLWANYLEMEIFYERCIELDPNNAIDYILDMENYYYNDGKLQEAIDWCCRFVDSEIPEIERLYGNLGGHYLELEQELKALECYNKGLELNSDDKIQCLEGIGNVLAFYQNKHSEALTYFLQIEELYPGEGSYYNMALCYEALREYEKALFYYQRSIGQYEDLVIEYDIIGKIEEISKKVAIEYPF
jgi:tetratricopeptide (TPR) repeat protein